MTDTSSMGEIPDDLREEARQLAIELRNAVDGCTCADCLVVAHEVALTALLAERERCAKVADMLPCAELTSTTATSHEMTFGVGAAAQRNAIAAAIRKGVSP